MPLTVVQNPLLKTTRGTKATVDELLACPAGSVLSGSWDSNANWTGVQCAELKRPGMAMRFYQYFSDCYQTVNKIHWWGVFNYWYSEDLNDNGVLDEGEDVDGDGEITQDWLYCGEKAGIDASGNATKAVNFEIKFYKVGSDGLPGEVVYEKTVSAMPRATGVVRQGEPAEYGQIYELEAELGETIKLESGFFSVAAVDDSDEPTCWFSVLTNDAVPGYGMTEVNGENWGQDRSMCYCLVGDGEYIAEKALKLVRVLSPLEGSNGKYEKVQVELMNIGVADIADARLELYAGDQLLATETVNATIGSFYTYKYTFEQRVDCSAAGEHTFTIKNVTDGDEQIAAQELSFSVETVAAGDVCESMGLYDGEHITSVKIGTIDNPSGETRYSDFTDMKTEIGLGETLELRVTAEGDVYISAWVDWNSNGSFDDEGELMGYLASADSYIPVTIAEGTEVTEGEKVLRVMATYYEEAPCGEYYYGETEDYTLVVVRPDEAPAIAVDKAKIESLRNQDTETIDLGISNEAGTSELTGTVTVQYALPSSPDTHGVNTMSTKIGKPVTVAKKALAKQARADGSADAADYVLKYDRGQYDVVALQSGDEVTYAQYYPGEMLSHIAGMQLGSVDVYLNDVPDEIKIVIYGENTQTQIGDLLAEKSFTPQAKSWNTVALDAPLAIGNTDLWIGVYMKGLGTEEYHIGIDEGPANIGFGDLVNIGGETWWSLADLGISSNFCIRANVTGERTKAIDWLSFDKETLAVAAGGQDAVAVTVDGQGLANTLYEAVISIASNDPMQPLVKVPVYMQSEGASGVEVPAVSDLSVYGDGAVLSLRAGADMQSVSLVGINGVPVKTVQVDGQATDIPLAEVQAGVYILAVQYADGSQANVKVPVVR